MVFTQVFFSLFLYYWTELLGFILVIHFTFQQQKLKFHIIWLYLRDYLNTLMKILIINVYAYWILSHCSSSFSYKLIYLSEISETLFTTELILKKSLKKILRNFSEKKGKGEKQTYNRGTTCLNICYIYIQIYL